MLSSIEELADSVPIPLNVAVQLIPMPSMAALYQFLNRNKALFPGKYRRSGGPGVARVGFEQRFLSKSEILKIREMEYRSKSETRFARAGRPASRTSGVIGSIIRRCEEARNRG
jgi:hypothetical protein